MKIGDPIEVCRPVWTQDGTAIVTRWVPATVGDIDDYQLVAVFADHTRRTYPHVMAGYEIRPQVRADA
jgi:hypothetical protein